MIQHLRSAGDVVLPPYLQECSDLLRDQGLSGANARQRAAMLAAVYDDLSERNLADVLHDVLGGDKHELLREAIEAHERLADSQVALEARARLVEAGWEFDDK